VVLNLVGCGRNGAVFSRLFHADVLKTLWSVVKSQ